MFKYEHKINDHEFRLEDSLNKAKNTCYILKFISINALGIFQNRIE